MRRPIKAIRGRLARSNTTTVLGLVELLVHWLSSLVKSRRRLEAENLVLPHQVNVLRRRASRRLGFSNRVGRPSSASIG